MKHDKVKNSSFILITLFLSGIWGYITIANTIGLSFLSTITHPTIIYMVLSSCNIYWIIYGIYKVYKKQPLTKANFLDCFLFAPMLVFAVIGQLGNRDAIAKLGGVTFGTIYYYLLIILYVYCLVVTFKNSKK